MALGMTRHQLIQNASRHEIQEWQAFWEMEGGFGNWKEDHRSAQICSIIANVNRNPKKRGRPYKTEDFAMRPRPKKGPMTKTSEQRIRAQLDAMAVAKPNKAMKRKKKKDVTTN